MILKNHVVGNYRVELQPMDGHRVQEGTRFAQIDAVCSQHVATRTMDSHRFCVGQNLLERTRPAQNDGVCSPRVEIQRTDGHRFCVGQNHWESFVQIDGSAGGYLDVRTVALGVGALIACRYL